MYVSTEDQKIQELENYWLRDGKFCGTLSYMNRALKQLKELRNTLYHAHLSKELKASLTVDQLKTTMGNVFSYKIYSGDKQFEKDEAFDILRFLQNHLATLIKSLL